MSSLGGSVSRSLSGCSNTGITAETSHIDDPRRRGTGRSAAVVHHCRQPSRHTSRDTYVNGESELFTETRFQHESKSKSTQCRPRNTLLSFQSNESSLPVVQVSVRSVPLLVPPGESRPWDTHTSLPLLHPPGTRRIGVLHPASPSGLRPSEHTRRWLSTEDGPAVPASAATVDHDPVLVW